MLNLDVNVAPYHLVEQLWSSHKYPNWIIKTLESVSLDQVGKTKTRSSTRQDGGGDLDNLDSSDVNDMDVSYVCELNLSINIKPNSFWEVISNDKWKEAMQMEYDALIKNGTWKLMHPPFLI